MRASGRNGRCRAARGCFARAVPRTVAAAAISAAASLFGASPSYTGPDTGNWNTAGNWSTSTVPANGDTVSIGAFSTARSGQVVTVTFNATNLSGTGLALLTLDSLNCQSEDLVLNGAGGALIAVNETIGNTIALNDVDQSAGSNLVADYLTLANGSNSSAVYNLSGGLVSSQVITVGNSGTATFNQTGGTCNVSFGLVLGQYATAAGTYMLSGTGILNANIIGLSENGTPANLSDTFIQTGGTCNVSNVSAGISIGGNGASIYNLSGGTLNCAGPEQLGYGINGVGTFLQTNGSNNAANLQIGYAGVDGGSGTYNLQGGTLTSSGPESVNIGTLIQSGGANNINSATLAVGTFNGSTGTYLLTGGDLTLVNSNEIIGNGGTGVFNQTNGTHFLNFNSALYIGNASSGSGLYFLQGGSLTLSIGSEYVGYNGTGTFNQTAGSNTIDNTLSGLYLGDDTGSTGTYNLIGGNLNVSGSVTVGYNGTGLFNQTGGVHNVTGSISMAVNGGQGAYLLSVGTINAVGGEFVGVYGNGSFTQASGVNNVSYDFEVAEHVGSTGVYLLSGGTLNVLGGASETVGDDGVALFEQTGGLNSVAAGGYFYEGSALLGVPGNTSVYNLSSGTLLAASGEYIGSGTGGIFTQFSGTNNASGQGLNVGGSGYSSSYTMFGGITNAASVNLSYVGNLNLSGGTLNTTAVNIAASLYSQGVVYLPGGTLNFSGGTLSTASLNLNGVPSDFNWTGGTLALTAGITFDPAASPTSTSAAFGSSLTLNSGMSLAVTGNETVGGAGFFTLILNPGSTDTATGSFTIAPAGTLEQDGGPIAQNLSNQGIFIYEGGTFSGQLVNQGTAAFEVSASIPGGVINSGNIAEIDLGVALTADGSGLNNSGSVTLVGGQINAPTGSVTNSGLITGYGVVAGASLTNSGVITQTGGNLQLSSGAVINNSGTINMTPGLSLTLLAPGSTNDGTINLDSGTLVLTGPLTNNADGAVAGPGKITGTFINNGTLDVPNGTTTIGSFTNTGVIEMSGVAAVLGSGATITNSNTIEGFGKISDSVTNNATIQPIGGTLTFTAPLTDSASGTISVPASGKVLMQGATTFPANAGLINLVGGTFDNGGNPLANNGSIIGYGILSTGGAGLTNNGAITFTGGTTTVNGNVTNTANKTINIKYQPAIFTGNLTNNAMATINTISTTFTVAGTFTNNGTYNSDPATTIFQSNVNNGGSINGVAGDQYIFYGGTFTNTGNFNNSGSIQSSDPTVNSGTFIQFGPQSWAPGTNFNNTAGAATFGSDAGAGGANLLVNVSGGTMTFAATQHLAGLNISSGATAVVTGAGNGHRSVIFTPSLAVTGTLDLTANDLDVQGGSLAAVTALVAQGYHGGTWTGAGITSSSAAADTTHLTAVGVILNTVNGTTPLYTTFDGASVAPNDVLAKYTYYGDANLDGKVDATDYSRIDNGYLNHLSGWYNGDFNYDGVINGSDFTLIDNAFNMQGAQLDADLASPAVSIAAEVAGSAAVPEPATLAGLSAMAIGLLGRRRRV